MDLTRFVEALRRDLVGAAEAAGPEGQAAADRLLRSLEPAVRLMVMEVLAQAAAEISADLPVGMVDVRLRGREPELVVDVPSDVARPVAVAPTAPTAPPTPPGAAEEEGHHPADDDIARITLRLPESLKTRIEEISSTSGHSLNAWIVQALRAATQQRQGVVDLDLTSMPFGGSRRMSGWV